jgi:hypothetical protein
VFHSLRRLLANAHGCIRVGIVPGRFNDSVVD